MRRQDILWVAVATVSLAGAYLALHKPAAEPEAAFAHADHRPKHGGSFFMAPNGFHHLEGTLRTGEFRLYLYDNFTRPIDVRPFRARVGARWLEPAPEGAYLRLRLDDVADARSRITAFVRFRHDRPEDRFDFIFAAAPPAEAAVQEVRAERLRDADPHPRQSQP